MENGDTIPALPPEYVHDDHMAKQAELTDSLLESPDPTVRMIAHISMRQLAMVEHLAELRKEVQNLSKAIESSQRSREEILSRLSSLEQKVSQTSSDNRVAAS